MNYKTPGAYVEEISKFPPSVAQVETAIPAFVGYTEKGNALKPVRITSLLEYETHFGGADAETAILATIVTEGSEFKLSSVDFPEANRSKYRMYYAMQMFFANGGGPCYVVSVGTYAATFPADAKDKLSAGLTALRKEDEPTLLVVPDAVSLSATDAYGQVYADALTQCEELQDRFAILDTVTATDAETTATAFRSGVPSSSALKYGAAYYPHLETVLGYKYENTDVAVSGYTDVTNLEELKAKDSGLYNQIKGEIASAYRVTVAPSAVMAGVYARTDSAVGVWKAPANTGLSYVVGPTEKITHKEQEGLNVDPNAGKSINAIRSFTGKGTLVWGARTLDGNSNEWRYVPVRRFFNMVEESVKNAAERFVFESNDSNTWIRMKGMIDNFLNQQWRAGALAGSTPDEAYYVSIGLNETMTPQDILEGRMNIEIGMAAVRPAEFIVLKFSHKLQES